MSDLTFGKIVNNSVTLFLSSHDTGRDAVTLAVANKHNDFFVNLPHHPSFTKKTRCLAFVESVTTARFQLTSQALVETQDGVQPVVLGVEIKEMTPQNMMFDKDIVPYVGIVQRTDGSGYSMVKDAYANQNPTGNTFVSHGDIIHNGILCHSPFGKRIRVRLVNLGNIDANTTGMGPNLFGSEQAVASNHNPTANPVHIKLRLLFLDNDDLKDY